MDRIIQNSFLSFEKLYHKYPSLGRLSINDYQTLTIIWNVFLILVPLAFYLILKYYWRRTSFLLFRQKAAAAVLFVFWLLFFPNTAYIITDVRHLINYCPVNSPDRVCAENAWMIMVFFAYSCVGWVSFYYLLKLMSELIKEIFHKFWSNLFIVLAIPAVSLGVLLGLLNRFNSWDAFFYPVELFKAFSAYFTDLNYFLDWLVFTGFLYLLYFAGNAIFRRVKI